MPLSWKKSITCLKLTFQEIPHKEFGCPEGWFLRIWVAEVWLWSVCVSKWCSDTLLPPAEALIMTNNTICSSACKILWHLTRIVFDFFLLWEILAILSLPVSAELWALGTRLCCPLQHFFCLGQVFQAVSIVFRSAFSNIPKSAFTYGWVLLKGIFFMFLVSWEGFVTTPVTESLPLTPSMYDLLQVKDYSDP